MLRIRQVLKYTTILSKSGMLLAEILAVGMLVSPLCSQSTAPSEKPATARTHYLPNHFPKRASMYYGSVWGVDSLSVKAVESGELIRFTYRIVDPSKATVFNDKKLDAFLDIPAAHARLVIPTMEKVGQLRQYNTPEGGKSYWMAFSNPRRTVKPGDRVNVVIGKFHADGLVVE